MDKKILDDSKLKQVNGGQAVLPLLSKEVDEQMLNATAKSSRDLEEEREELIANKIP